MSCSICTDRATRTGSLALVVPDDEAPTLGETLVCEGHFAALRRLLNPAHRGDPNRPEADPPSIPRLDRLLSPFRKPAPGREDEPTGPTVFGPSAPVDFDHLARRDPRSSVVAKVWTDRKGRAVCESETPPLSAFAVLAPWVGKVVELRGVAAPVPIDPVVRPERYVGPMTEREAYTHAVTPRPRLSVEDLAEFLDRHLDWLAARPAIVPFAAQLTLLSRGLRTAVQHETGEYRPKPFSTCPAVIDHEVDPETDAVLDVLCGADLFPPRLGDTITCHTCGSWWAFADWWPAQAAPTSLAGAAA